MLHSIHDIESYDIAGKGMPDDVEKKVRLIHRPMLERVQAHMPAGVVLGISLRSAYRTREWEKSRRRSGYSEHVFSGFGAVDITCRDFDKNRDTLLDALMCHGFYTRLAVYGSFIHCDFKNKLTDRWVYNHKWVRLYKFDENGPLF